MRLILDDLIKSGTRRTAEESVNLFPDRPLSDRLRAWLSQELGLLYREAGLNPPTLREVTARFPRQGPEILRGLLHALAMVGTLRRVNDALYYCHEALAVLQERIVSHLQEYGETDIQGFKALTGMTRKFLVPVLEHLDEIGVTKRLDNGNRALTGRLNDIMTRRRRADGTDAMPLH